jgi:uncharacterized membrane protein
MYLSQLVAADSIKGTDKFAGNTTILSRLQTGFLSLTDFLTKAVNSAIYLFSQELNLSNVITLHEEQDYCRPVVPKGSMTISHGIHGYISVMAVLKFTYIFN